MLKNSLDVLDGLDEVHSSQGSGSLVSVFEMRSQVINSAFSSYTNIISTYRSTLITRPLSQYNIGSVNQEMKSLHLVSLAGCLEYLTIANLNLLINNKIVCYV